MVSPAQRMTLKSQHDFQVSDSLSIMSLTKNAMPSLPPHKPPSQFSDLLFLANILTGQLAGDL